MDNILSAWRTSFADKTVKKGREAACLDDVQMVVAVVAASVAELECRTLAERSHLESHTQKISQ